MQRDLRKISGTFPAKMVFLTVVLFSSSASAQDSRVESISEAAPQRAQLEERFAAESVDAEWAPTAETSFRETARGAAAASAESILATVEISTFECRSTSCKIEATLPGPGHFRPLMTALNEVIPWDHTGEWFLVSTEPAILVGYVSRESAVAPRDAPVE